MYGIKELTPQRSWDVNTCFLSLAISIQSVTKAYVKRISGVRIKEAIEFRVRLLSGEKFLDGDEVEVAAHATDLDGRGGVSSG